MKPSCFSTLFFLLGFLPISFAQKDPLDCSCFKKEIQDAESRAAYKTKELVQLKLKNYKICLLASNDSVLLKKVQEIEWLDRFKEGKSLAISVWGKVLIDSNFNVLQQLPANTESYAGNRLLISKQYDAFGITDLEGNVITPFQYRFIQALYSESDKLVGFSCLHENDGLTILDTNNRVMHVADNVGGMHTYFGSLIKVSENGGQSYFLNSSMKVVVPATERFSINALANLFCITDETHQKIYIFSKNGRLLRELNGLPREESFGPDSGFLVYRNETNSFSYEVAGDTIHALGLFSGVYPEKNLVYVSSGELQGAIDFSGKVLVPPVYQSCKFLLGDWFEVKKNEQSYFYNQKTGELHLKPKNKTTAIELTNKLNCGIEFSAYPFYIGKKIPASGYRSAWFYDVPNSGTKVYKVYGQPIYFEFENGHGSIRSDDSELIDVFTGDSIAWDHESNHYRFFNKGKCGAINEKGEVVLQSNYDEIRFSHRGELLYVVKKQGKCGVVISDSVILVPINNYEVVVFDNDFGVARMETDNLNQVYFMKPFLVHPEYGQLRPIVSGKGKFCKIEKDGMYGVYDLENQKTILKTEFYTISIASDKLITENSKGEWIYDLSGNLLNDKSLLMIAAIGNCFVGVRDEIVYILKPGLKSFMATNYDNFDFESVNEIIVSKEGKRGLLDENGKECISPKYKQLRFANTPSLYWFSNDGEFWGLINSKGVELHEPEFIEIDNFYYGMAKAHTAGGKIVTIDTLGNIK